MLRLNIRWLPTNCTELPFAWPCLPIIPGSNGPCLVRMDIRMDSRVTIDILVELSVPLWISVAHCPRYHGYPCQIICVRMDVVMEIHGKPWISTRISTLTREHGPFDLGWQPLNTFGRAQRMYSRKYSCSYAYGAQSCQLGHMDVNTNKRRHLK